MIRTYSATHFGPEGVLVEIETSLQKALPAIVITGLPGDVVKESRERIRACLWGLGYELPSARLVVHLSPASAKKQGSQLDLGIAAAILATENAFQQRRDIRRVGFLGELTIDGRVLAVPGALALAQVLLQSGHVDCLVVPGQNSEELGLLDSDKVFAVKYFSEVVQFLSGNSPLVPVPAVLYEPDAGKDAASLDRVQGQRFAKRALQVALAGRHHFLMVGPPGVGKSLLAHTAKSLLPPLEKEELIELTKNQGYFEPSGTKSAPRPFRSPHHSISVAGLLGGGTGTVQSGEVTLSHGGILFMDELPEFRKDALEGLREPLQTGEIHLTRVGVHITLPARFLLIAAMNPCPCGYGFDTEPRRCSCPRTKAAAYRQKISGPLYDRIDLSAVLSRASQPEGEPFLTHAEVKETIRKVHEIQRTRFRNTSYRFNSEAEVDLNAGPFAVGTEEKSWLEGLCQKNQLSFRSLHKTVRIARTLADLAEANCVSLDHLREAWSLRCRDFTRPSPGY